VTGTKELAGATKLFVKEGITVDDACAIGVEILKEDELDVAEGRRIRGVGVIVAVFDV
jgi:hypothetical protein